MAISKTQDTSASRVAIGVASERQEGWAHLTQAELDVTCRSDWLGHFQPGSLDNILAEHVWEHLTWGQAQAATRLCFEFLRPGGRLRLAVPDTLHASAFIVDAVSATGSRAAEHHHIVDYDYRLMSRLFIEAGFRTALRDWWDEAGTFHSDYDGKDVHGYVMRSYANWPRHPSVYRDPDVHRQIVDSVPEELRASFIAREISHTSLIVDGIRPE